MNPTRTLDTADFSLHRVIFSSRQRVSRTFSQSTDFRCQIDLPRNVDIFRFAIRRVTFPNVASAWDLSNAPYIYYRILEIYDSATYTGVYRTRLVNRYTAKSDVAPVGEDTAPTGNQLAIQMRTLSPGITEYYSGFQFGVHNYADATLSKTYAALMNGGATEGTKFQCYYETANDTHLTFKCDPGVNMQVQLLGVSESDAGGDQIPAHYGNNILGIASTISAIADIPRRATFPVNLTGNLHVYLCSTILTATARSMRPIFAPVENCVIAIPVASTYLTLVDHRPESPTIWNCNQDNHWDVVDFQLRYDTGGIVDLGGNDIEIEIEFEVMEQFNPPLRQMQEAIYLPNVNVYDTTKLLLKRDNRSWGSYGGRTDAGQFSMRGPSSGVFR